MRLWDICEKEGNRYYCMMELKGNYWMAKEVAWLYEMCMKELEVRLRFEEKLYDLEMDRV